MSIHALPSEIIHKIIGYLPQEILQEIAPYNDIAFNLLHKDIFVSDKIDTSHNTFPNLKKVSEFVEENPQYIPYHLVLDSDQYLSSSFDVSVFKFVSINKSSMIPCFDHKYKSVQIDFEEYEDNRDPTELQNLDVRSMVIANGKPGTIPRNLEKLTLYHTAISIQELEQLPYLQSASLYSSLNEPFKGKLQNLRSLALGDYSKNGDLRNLDRLVYLELANVNDLKFLPPNVQTLKLSDGQKLTDLSAIEEMKSLKALHLNVYYVCNYPGFYKLKYPNLTELRINFDNVYFDIYDEINSMSLPSTLRSFSLSNCEDLCLSSLSLPDTLEVLQLANILELNQLRLSTNLRILDLHDVLEINDVSIPDHVETIIT